jgi:hypothetical protein
MLSQAGRSVIWRSRYRAAAPVGRAAGMPGGRWATIRSHSTGKATTSPESLWERWVGACGRALLMSIESLTTQAPHPTGRYNRLLAQYPMATKVASSGVCALLVVCVL